MMINTLVVKIFLLSICVTFSLRSVSAFTLTFPTSSWVSCKANVLQWSFDNNDPDIFSVALFNENRTKLNGNYQIANSLPTRNGSAIVRPNCVEPSSGYYLSFVNASKYAENQPQVYYTSPTFSIVAPSQMVPTPDGTKLINNDTTLVNSDGSSIIATSSDVSGTSTNSSASSSSSSSSSSDTLYKPAVAATPLSGISSTSQTNSSSSTSSSKNNAQSGAILSHVMTLIVASLAASMLLFTY